ncbi:hypothetical protein PAHAL_3G003600 [Panicum hallii]|uniref:Serine incorporator n=1 Tax=Panicum hallii TaxID=206008 RepID=A0A2T8KGI3_9POAL|nr:hypothetical protein PAHAL_3G003600 [Panicum hallii]
MFFSTVYTNKLHDRRNSWHSQWGPAKMLLLAGSVMISTFAPTYWIQLYGKVAPFGAGLMRFITNLNKWCQTNFETWYRLVITVSIIAYICSTVGSIFMCFRYTGCWLNIAFIGTTLLLVHLMYLIPLIKSQTNGFYMEPGLAGAYIVFLCYSAIRSEPAETDSYKKEKASASADWKTIVSFVIELGSIAGAVFSTGKDYKCIQLRNVVESEDDVPYGYGFFHFVFAMGSMYFGMLFIGWDMHHIMDKFSMDVGWMSVWVHIVNEGLTVLSFVAIAILVARIYEIGWLRQLLARIFGIGSQQPPPPPPPSSEMNILRSSNNDDDTGAPPLPLPRSPPQATEEFQEVVSSSDDIAGPPPLPVNIGSRNDDVHAAGSSSSRPAAACATAGRRRVPGGNWWTTIMRRLTTRKLMLFFLCVHVTFILSLAFLYMMYTHRSTQ